MIKSLKPEALKLWELIDCDGMSISALFWGYHEGHVEISQCWVVVISGIMLLELPHLRKRKVGVAQTREKLKEGLFGRNQIDGYREFEIFWKRRLFDQPFFFLTDRFMLDLRRLGLQIQVLALLLHQYGESSCLSHEWASYSPMRQNTDAWICQISYQILNTFPVQASDYIN